jgi:hypothetical protein
MSSEQVPKVRDDPEGAAGHRADRVQRVGMGLAIGAGVCGNL